MIKTFRFSGSSHGHCLEQALIRLMHRNEKQTQRELYAEAVLVTALQGLRTQLAGKVLAAHAQIHRFDSWP